MNIKSKLEKYIISSRDKLKISSKDIKKGDIFLALKGSRYHGNKFIKLSLIKGAKYCLTDNKNYQKNKNVILVENIFDYLKEIAIKKRKLYKGKVIGITGSAGKTTLKESLAFFLKKDFTISYSQKSYNNELGVLISLLNLNLKSTYSIFEIGTNNFGEIEYLTKIVQPTEIFITNIQPTHLENFKTKKNIAKEKSNIFISKHNKQKRRLYLNILSNNEKLLLNKAKKQKNLKIIRIDKDSNKYFLKKIINKGDGYEVTFCINKKIFNIKLKSIVMFRIHNLLFCLAFFSENKINIQSIIKRERFLKPVNGRGLSHTIKLNNKNIKIIDESYNANPETMNQSIEYFSNMKNKHNNKILILGNMNELGVESDLIHLKLLKFVNKYSFKFVILCGEILGRSIRKLINPINEYIYLEDKNKIMKYLNKKVHNNDIILIKCSNSTQVNIFTKDLLKKGNKI